MKINDRGSIKWTAMMLPEHKERLADLFQEQSKVLRPILDEQKKQEINDRIIEAIEHDIEIEFCLYEDGKIQRVSGIITSYSLIHREIQLANNHGETYKFSTKSVIDAWIV
jgi:hypothetical protein